MDINTDYRINNVTVSTNGRNEIYFDVEWEGDENLDYFELRILESGVDNNLEAYAYPMHNQRVVVKSHYLLKGWKSGEVNNESFVVELGIAHYTDEGKQLGWEVLAAYEPINIGLYYEQHIFRKNILQIR